jgi:uncharacterized protein YndB with AHSA1/START domain
MTMAATTAQAKSGDSLRKELLVEAPQERAFRVFTENFDAWWPREHHIGKAALKKAVLEGKAGGGWYELGEDGSRCEWGKVLVWDPPRRLVMAWQINAQWQYDAGFVTEVEVRFTPEGARRTRVELEHRNLEKFGTAAEDMKKSFQSDGGWTGLLKLFAQAAEKAQG